MKNSKEYNRQYKADQRAEARAAGLCGTCCTRWPEPGKATCNHCMTEGTKRRRKARRIARKVAREKGNAK